MAMIKCPDCKTGGSEHAQICPKCGYPIANYIQQCEEARQSLYNSLKSENKDAEFTSYHMDVCMVRLKVVLCQFWKIKPIRKKYITIIY